jgi:hypothetical protein
MTWTLPSMPTPSSSFTNRFTINGVAVLQNGTPVTANIAFYNLSVNDGGISACATSTTCNPFNDLSLFNTYDYQVYSGGQITPMFTPGTYAEPATEDEATEGSETDTWAFSGSTDNPNLTLTITSAPEPSSMLLLGSGLLGLMGMGLRRKRLA